MTGKAEELPLLGVDSGGAGLGDIGLHYVVETKD